MVKTLRRHSTRRAVSALLCVAAFGACKDDAPAKPAPAAKVANPITESQLTSVTLSVDAVTRLGIATETVDSTSVGAGRTVGGVVMVPPGHSLVVSAPVAGTVLAPAQGAIPQAGTRVSRGQTLLRLAPLPPDRDLQRTDETLEVARARLAQATTEAERMRSLHADRLVSTRDFERAQADLVAARTAFATAEAQQRLVAGGGRDGRGIAALVVTAPASGTVLSLSAGPGQVVPAGAPLFEVVELDALWVRVAVFPGDAAAVNRRATVTVTSLAGAGSGAQITGSPVTAPPTADAASSSVDLYYALSGVAGRLRPGERVNVTVPVGSGGAMALTVPAASVVHDIYGGAWVYERIDSLTFARRRIEITRMVDGRAVITRGPAAGTSVVTSGAAELFGVEFGPGK